MGRGFRRAERLREMERLYVDRAYSDREMAERMGTHRTTIFRDRLDLEREVPFVEVRPGWYKIDRLRYLSAIRLNLHEALALYLAARRASRQTRYADPHMATALEKLAGALRQPMTGRLLTAASGVMAQPPLPARVRVHEVVATAWSERQKVAITYRPLRAIGWNTYALAPYLIEPSLWSDGAYVVGPVDPHGGLRTFKLERIEHAEPLGEAFEVPAGFDERALFHHAWGIWYGDAEPVTVRLRFHPGAAARRVRETVWHPTQTIEDEAGDGGGGGAGAGGAGEDSPGGAGSHDDRPGDGGIGIDRRGDDRREGGCVWTARVADWREMLPWVRGWGADVAVLEPAALRERVVAEARAVAKGDS